MSNESFEEAIVKKATEMSSEESERTIETGEELFIELCKAALDGWIRKHEDDILQRVVEKYDLQKRKKPRKM